MAVGNDNGLTFWQGFKLFADKPMQTIYSDTVFLLGLDNVSGGVGETFEVDAFGDITAYPSPNGLIDTAANSVTGRLTQDQKTAIQQNAYDSVFAVNQDAAAAQKAFNEIGTFIDSREGGTAEAEVSKDVSVAGNWLTGIAVVIGIVFVWHLVHEL